jgi:hypothetical protein
VEYLGKLIKKWKNKKNMDRKGNGLWESQADATGPSSCPMENNLIYYSSEYYIN